MCVRVSVCFCKRTHSILLSLSLWCVCVCVSLSQREYRRDYEQQVKGKALLDVDQTPGYLTARHASSLLSEVTHTVSEMK